MRKREIVINTKETYILIPSYEPDESLPTLVAALKKEGFDIILVNDGSGEKYQPIFDSVKNDVNYLEQRPNKGKGQALRLGFSFANLNQDGHKFIITCDGDGQHSIQDILKINKRLNEVNRPCFGVRTFDKSTPKRSRNGNFMSRLCRTLITKDFIQDDQCGLRGFPLSYMNELTTIKGDRYEYEMNVVCTFQMKRFRIEEVPIETIYIDNNSSSHFSPGMDTFRIQRVIWTYSLLPVMTYLMVFIAFIFTSFLVQEWWHSFLLFGGAVFTEIFLQFGLLSIIFPTRQVGRRAMVEGMFFSIKTIVAFGLYVVFDYLLKLPHPLSYFIATFVVAVINYFLAILIHRIKMKRVWRLYK